MQTSLLPAICQSRDFVFSTDLQAQQYASNDTLVFQLQDAVDIWISRCEGILRDFELVQGEADSRFVSVSAIAARLNRVQLDSEFYQQFELNEPAAVLRVLRAKKDTNRIARLESCAAALKANHARIETTTSLLNDFVDLFDSEWKADNIADVVSPLLSCCRAIWFCDPMFGRAHPKRFQTLVASVVAKAQLCVTTACSGLVAKAFDDPRTTLSAKSIVLSCQEGLVTLQEGLCELLSCAGLDGKEVAEYDVFSLSDFMFQRLVIALEICDLIQRDPAKCGKLSHKLNDIDVLSTSIATSDLLTLLTQFRDATPDSPKSIIRRIEEKSNRPMAKPVVKYVEGSRRLCVTISLVLEGRSTLIVQGTPLIDVHILEIEKAFVECFDLTAGSKDFPKPLPVALPKGRGFVVDAFANVITEAHQMRLFQQLFAKFEELGWRLAASHATGEAPGTHVLIFE